MSRKMRACVQQLMAEGYSQAQAERICAKDLGKQKRPNGSFGNAGFETKHGVKKQTGANKARSKPWPNSSEKA